MSKQIYEVVEHDGGFAYKVGDVFSETFETHERAHRAAEEAAARQQLSSEPDMIQYQDADGNWHTELARGDVRPETDVRDDLP
ncbi:DUF2188 domain-containing protein [Arsenicitalea aurantiaca]|uniref:DUF2188 domain-containing protein n=1 Tax=Arsenicitalea aurantiaca TaxID=1783274 RepID=A0A433X8K7_9HYPH|nr:DUF2188 domain-containing protein [Arsenicitalea aurantiaca]RUT30380.1 DUF2188 domain-containing protein [Arsenicitalea aurantiaca]